MKATIEGISTTTRFQRHECGPEDGGLKLSVIEKESELTGGIEGTAVVRYTGGELARLTGDGGWHWEVGRKDEAYTLSYELATDS